MGTDMKPPFLFLMTATVVQHVHGDFREEEFALGSDPSDPSFRTVPRQIHQKI
jgi:hypothetical protein